MKSRIKAVICVLSALVILAGSCYVNDYYKAMERAIEATSFAEYLEEDTLVFEADSKYGIIFYPGGKVEHTAYAPLMKACAEAGITCVLVHMPCNLAVLDIDAAQGIQERFPKVEDWYMAGHSLGGSMAASYIVESAEEYKGLILLASYSTENLNEGGLKVLSVYGTEDEVLNMEKYEENRGNLPGDYEEVVIDGGCHAYFGNYGEQEGDGEAKISPGMQQEITVEAIKNFIK